MIDGHPPVRVREVSPADDAMLQRIGRLRVEVWHGEQSLNPAIVAAGVWLDDIDRTCSHWVAETDDDRLVAAGRLSLHERYEDSIDGFVWQRAGRPLPLPFASLSRLVVATDARGLGLASTINSLRVEAARARGARSMTATASPANARLLLRLGFVDTGLTSEFANFPGRVFPALELIFA